MRGIWPLQHQQHQQQEQHQQQQQYEDTKSTVEDTRRCFAANGCEIHFEDMKIAHKRAIAHENKRKSLRGVQKKQQ